jgi:hypothetical protein
MSGMPAWPAMAFEPERVGPQVVPIAEVGNIRGKLFRVLHVRADFANHH